MSARDPLIDAGIEAAKAIRKQAEARLDKIDRSVSESADRANKVYQRAHGTVFEPFGTHRRTVADGLVDNPPNKLATAVRIGSVVVTGALLLYSALTRKKSDQE